MTDAAHGALIRDQFTRQAAPFGSAAPIADPGDEEKLLALFAAAALDERLGIPVHCDGDKLRYAYPVAILAAARR